MPETIDSSVQYYIVITIDYPLSKKFYQLNENKKYHTAGRTVPKSDQKL